MLSGDIKTESTRWQDVAVGVFGEAHQIEKGARTIFRPAVFALAGPKEHGHRAGAGVAADRRADGKDLRLSVHLREQFCDVVGHGLRVVLADRLAKKALARIVVPVLGELFHFLYNAFHHLALGSHFLARFQLALFVHIQQGPDL